MVVLNPNLRYDHVCYKGTALKKAYHYFSPQSLIHLLS